MSPKAAGSEKGVSLQTSGGLLGAGKTTTLLQLAERYLQFGKSAGIIINDQAEDLVDTALIITPPTLRVGLPRSSVRAWAGAPRPGAWPKR